MFDENGIFSPLSCFLALTLIFPFIFYDLSKHPRAAIKQFFVEAIVCLTRVVLYNSSGTLHSI